jgi:uncharacterized membrane protein YqiK
MRSNERMKEAIDFLSGGLLSEYEDTISKAKTEIAEAKAKVEVVEAKAKAEVAEAEAKVAEAKVAEAEAKAAADKLKFQSQIVALKMKLKDIDLNFISECTGLSIEEINHI